MENTNTEEDFIEEENITDEVQTENSTLNESELSEENITDEVENIDKENPEPLLEEKKSSKKKSSKSKKAEGSPVLKSEVEFTFGEKKYKFQPSAPVLIRILGEVKSQEEIAKDEDLILHLVGGNSGLIEEQV